VKFPFVTIKVTSPMAAWFAKWTINTDSDNARKLGAPFATEAEAQAVCDKLNGKAVQS